MARIKAAELRRPDDPRRAPRRAAHAADLLRRRARRRAIALLLAEPSAARRSPTGRCPTTSSRSPSASPEPFLTTMKLVVLRRRSCSRCRSCSTRPTPSSCRRSTPSERRVVLPLLLMVPVLFIAGVVFAYFVVVPAALKFLLGFNADQFNIQIRASEYYSFFVAHADLGRDPLPDPGRDPRRHPARRSSPPSSSRQEPPLRDPDHRRPRDAAARHRPGDDADLDGAARPPVRVQPDPRAVLRQPRRRAATERRAGRAPAPNRPARRSSTLPACSSNSAASASALIQVIYVCLALLMFIALVGFGIGGGAIGGIFDALGIGGGNTLLVDPQYDAADPTRRGHPADRSEEREGPGQRSPAPTSSPARRRPEPTHQGQDHLHRRDADRLPGRHLRLGALPGDEPEAARRRRRVADAPGLLGARRHRSGADPAGRRSGVQGGADRRRRARRASAPTSSSPPTPTTPATRRPAPRRSRRRSQKAPDSTVEEPGQGAGQAGQGAGRRRSRRRSSRAPRPEPAREPARRPRRHPAPLPAAAERPSRSRSRAQPRPAALATITGPGD